jgi:hypothetical protein
MFWLRASKILGKALAAMALVILVKWFLHRFGLEPIEQTSMHNSVISSAIFVIGFLLSATIADYKESERIPAEFSSTIESIYEDAREIHRTYPKFDLEKLRVELVGILGLFRDGTREKRRGTRREISELNEIFGQMEAAGVPPNYVVKLKQQQAQLLRNIYRVNYIQKIRFIPSAYILVWSISAMVTAVLLLTNVEPFFGSLILTGVVSFVLSYMVMLIHVVGFPFRPSGTTYDDVSLFLLDETKDYLHSRAANQDEDA